MKEIRKYFLNVKSEQEWLSGQVRWRLAGIKGFRYTFEESACEYYYEYIYFDKNKSELDHIRQQITDSDIEFVCNSSSWALFRKDKAKGRMRLFEDDYLKYRMLMKKYSAYMGLGACYLCLGSSQVAVAVTVNGLYGFASVLFYLCGVLFFSRASFFKKYASEYGDGS